MQHSGRKSRHSSGAQEEHVEHALEHIAEEKLQELAGKSVVVREDMHGKLHSVIARMDSLTNESQFYLLVNEALSIHQKGWEEMSEMERQINSHKRF